MGMRNAKNAHFWLIDHAIKKIARLSQVEILSSSDAWKRKAWSRKYFGKKPQEGYFIWVKDQPPCPLFTCISLATKRTKQNLKNLLVIEECLEIELQGFCGSLNNYLQGTHQAQGNVILKKGSSLKYLHHHFWGKDDFVEPDYKFLLEEGARLDYTYETRSTPKTLKLKTSIDCLSGSKASINILADCKNTNFETRDLVTLKGKGASGITKLRLIARENSEIKAYSQILAKADSSGHLDCQALIIDECSKVTLVPKVICKNKEARVTHEASIGRISEEQLNYLRMRGLTEEKAVNLIVAGFLEK